MTLGYSALDKGHFLEALEYFDTVWNFFPDLRAQNPDLAMSIALCRKMLGLGEKTGERYGLVGQWKLDEGTGASAADSSGYDNTGTVQGPANWVPGKAGTALRFDWTNVVSVPATTFLNFGTGGAGYSITFWLNWESPNPHSDHFFVVKRGGSADEMVGISGVGKARLGYTVATQSPKWETGFTKTDVPLNRWNHVAFVKTDANEVRIYLNGKLDLCETLKTPALRNTGGINIGRHMNGSMDDVRLYSRPLLDREVAEMAGAVGAAKIAASPAAGEAPLAVEFSCPGAADPKAVYFWEFGDGQSARGQTVRHTYGLGGDYDVLLSVTDSAGAISVGRTKVAAKWRAKDEDFARRMGQVIR